MPGNVLDLRPRLPSREPVNSLPMHALDHLVEALRPFGVHLCPILLCRILRFGLDEAPLDALTRETLHVLFEMAECQAEGFDPLVDL